MFVFPCSYYPLYPPVDEVNMDYEKFQSFGQMPLTPDVLIIPSELRYFVKVRTAVSAHKHLVQLMHFQLGMQ